MSFNRFYNSNNGDGYDSSSSTVSLEGEVALTPSGLETQPEAVYGSDTDIERELWASPIIESESLGGDNFTHPDDMGMVTENEPTSMETQETSASEQDIESHWALDDFCASEELLTLVEASKNIKYENVQKYIWTMTAFENIIIHWVAEQNDLPFEDIDKENPLKLSQKDLNALNALFSKIPSMFAKASTSPSITAVIPALHQFECRLKKTPLFASSDGVKMIPNRLEVIISRLIPSIFTSKKLTIDTRFQTKDFFAEITPVLAIIAAIGVDLNLISSLNWASSYHILKTLIALEQQHLAALKFEYDLPINRKERYARTLELLDRYVDPMHTKSLHSNWIAEFAPKILYDVQNIERTLMSVWQLNNPYYMQMSNIISTANASFAKLYRLNFKEIIALPDDENELAQLPEEERKVRQSYIEDENKVLNGDYLQAFEGQLLLDVKQLLQEMKDSPKPSSPYSPGMFPAKKQAVLPAGTEDPLFNELLILAKNYKLFPPPPKP